MLYQTHSSPLIIYSIANNRFRVDGRREQVHENVLSCGLFLAYFPKIEIGLCDHYPVLRFQVLRAASMKFRVFWDVAPLVTLKLTLQRCVLPPSGRAV
jgi:hypothetical protein